MAVLEGAFTAPHPLNSLGDHRTGLDILQYRVITLRGFTGYACGLLYGYVIVYW